jgi:hypothetical protein
MLHPFHIHTFWHQFIDRCPVTLELSLFCEDSATARRVKNPLLDSWPLATEEGTDRLLRNVGRELALLAA